MSNPKLHELARDAGIEITWRDVDGNQQTVADDIVAEVLAAIGLPAASPAQIAESAAQLRADHSPSLPKLLTATVHEPVALTAAGAYKLTLESGAVLQGVAENGALPPVTEPGYHHLEIAGGDTILAVAPARAFTLEDAAQGSKLWGLAVQLYGLRREGAGIGDFAGLASFVRQAAGLGADAVAISPVHAQFSNNVTRFGPYAPSSRAAFNIMHIAEPVTGDDGDIIDWPRLGAAKLQALRAAYAGFSQHEHLASYRQTAGAGVELHAVFEALQAEILKTQPDAYDWRHWPTAYRNPHSPEVQAFRRSHADEIAFHYYLQYRAETELATAQTAARDSGMKIGLITDLAVGTDPAGSHSWSRPDDLLRGLEIGAPPDLINREGQGWGITAFSPHGLRASGYAGFIEMLRHALRHAGGVRIDHVMGLARLWVIPAGYGAKQGAYLRLPSQDLLRLVALESQRHRAVILGEDLGTLPEGYHGQLAAAGIAGLRVMWFERTGDHFNPPANWTRTAVAMTTTHDLPTVAGWWQGTDIAWRARLGMAGDSAEVRAADRAELWAAFRSSGAAHAPIPNPDDGAAAADAAAAHLGTANSLLALLPLEDALGLTEQPNLPGTTDEHPNWRRRLPADTDALLTRPDVVQRLATLNKARRG